MLKLIHIDANGKEEIIDLGKISDINILPEKFDIRGDLDRIQGQMREILKIFTNFSHGLEKEKAHYLIFMTILKIVIRESDKNNSPDAVNQFNEFVDRFVFDEDRKLN